MLFNLIYVKIYLTILILYKYFNGNNFRGKLYMVKIREKPNRSNRLLAVMLAFLLCIGTTFVAFNVLRVFAYEYNSYRSGYWHIEGLYSESGQRIEEFSVHCRDTKTIILQDERELGLFAYTLKGDGFLWFSDYCEQLEGLRWHGHIGWYVSDMWTIANHNTTFHDYTIKFARDMDLSAHYWQTIPAVKNMHIDGRGHTIYGLAIRANTILTIDHRVSFSWGETRRNLETMLESIGFIGYMFHSSIREITFANANIDVQEPGWRTHNSTHIGWMGSGQREFKTDYHGIPSAGVVAGTLVGSRAVNVNVVNSFIGVPTCFTSAHGVVAGFIRDSDFGVSDLGLSTSHITGSNVINTSLVVYNASPDALHNAPHSGAGFAYIGGITGASVRSVVSNSVFRDSEIIITHLFTCCCAYNAYSCHLTSFFIGGIAGFSSATYMPAAGTCILNNLVYNPTFSVAYFLHAYVGAVAGIVINDSVVNNVVIGAEGTPFISHLYIDGEKKSTEVLSYLRTVVYGSDDRWIFPYLRCCCDFRFNLEINGTDNYWFLHTLKLWRQFNWSTATIREKTFEGLYAGGYLHLTATQIFAGGSDVTNVNVWNRGRAWFYNMLEVNPLWQDYTWTGSCSGKLFPMWFSPIEIICECGYYFSCGARGHFFQQRYYSSRFHFEAHNPKIDKVVGNQRFIVGFNHHFANLEEAKAFKSEDGADIVSTLNDIRAYVGGLWWAIQVNISSPNAHVTDIRFGLTRYSAWVWNNDTIDLGAFWFVGSSPYSNLARYLPVFDESGNRVYRTYAPQFEYIYCGEQNVWFRHYFGGGRVAGNISISSAPTFIYVFNENSGVYYRLQLYRSGLLPSLPTYFTLCESRFGVWLEIIEVDYVRYLINLAAGNSLELLLTQFAVELEHIVVVGNDGQVITALGATNVATGITFKLVDGDNVLDKVVLVLAGDTNGDGIVNVSDVAYIYMHDNFFDAFELTGAFLLAADINRDGIVNISDVAYIYMHDNFFDTFNLFYGLCLNRQII